MKKVLALILTLAMVLGLAACGGSSGKPKSYEPEEIMTQEEMRQLVERLFRQYKEETADPALADSGLGSTVPLTLSYAMEYWLDKDSSFQFEETVHLLVFRLMGTVYNVDEGAVGDYAELVYDMDTGTLYHSMDGRMQYNGENVYPTKEDFIKVVLNRACSYDVNSTPFWKDTEARNVLQQAFVDAVNQNVAGQTQQEIHDALIAPVDWQIEPPSGEITEEHQLALDAANRFLEETGREYLDLSREMDHTSDPVYISDAAIYQFPAESGYPENCLLINLAGRFLWSISQDQFCGRDYITLLYDLNSGELYDISMVATDENGVYLDEGNPNYACMIEYSQYFNSDGMVRIAGIAPVKILIRQAEAIADGVLPVDPMTDEIQPEHQQEPDVAVEPLTGELLPEHQQVPDVAVEPLTGELLPEHQQVLDVVEQFLAGNGKSYLDRFYEETQEILPLRIRDAAMYQLPADQGYPENCLLINLEGGFCYGEGEDVGIFDRMVLLYDPDTGELYDSTMVPSVPPETIQTRRDGALLCLNTYSNINFGWDTTVCEEQTVTVLVRDGAAVIG